MTARASTEVAPRDACLMFRNGKLVAVETRDGTYAAHQIATWGLLSFTDQMILTKLAERVDKLIDQLGGK